MADSVTQPDTNDPDSSRVAETAQNNYVLEASEPVTLAEQPPAAMEAAASSAQKLSTIWTPRFITAFVLILIIGMSLDSILSQDWVTGYGGEFWVLFPHAIIVLGSWIAALVIVQSLWVRLGSIFGCVWTTFTALNVLASYLHFFHTPDVVASTNALISCSLLGLSICLSMNSIAPGRWDTWFFRLVIPAGIAIAAIPYALTFASNPQLSALESDVAFAAVLLSLLTWWLRPSCWKSQPGPTLLFGIVPAILLYLAIPGTVTRMTNVFFLETLDLCMFLGILRIIQGDRQRNKARL